MDGWKNIKEEFPKDKSKLYLVRTIDSDGWNQTYLCNLTVCTYLDGNPLELAGLDCVGRRFSIHEPKNDLDAGQSRDLFEFERKIEIFWQEIAPCF